MSLSLLQGYSSVEEVEEGDKFLYEDSSDDEDDEREETLPKNFSIHFPPAPSCAGSLLPSALDVFSEIAGPPEFLNNCVEEHNPASDIYQKRGWHTRRRNLKEKKDLPPGAVLESKAQLVGIHERVRSHIDGDAPLTSNASGKRVITASNPNAEDAAELLRMCLQCGIPKTFSDGRGMVCPVCGDRPPADPTKLQEKKGSAIKDKEKSKRMKGQSSHATWKSETEMQLRQQFD